MDFEKIVPICGSLNRVIIRPDEVKEITEGGVYIPEQLQEIPDEGTVVAVSKVDNEGVAPTVKVGDKVLFNKTGASTIPIDGVGHYICRENDVYCIVLPGEDNFKPSYMDQKYFDALQDIREKK